ncbi:hypothetical protein ACLOJK_028277, partial [Asimina triloba]
MSHGCCWRVGQLDEGKGVDGCGRRTGVGLGDDAGRGERTASVGGRCWLRRKGWPALEKRCKWAGLGKMMEQHTGAPCSRGSL